MLACVELVHTYVHNLCSSSTTSILHEPEAAGLRKVAVETGTTLFVVLMAVFQLLLSKYGREKEVVVGTPYAERRSVATWRFRTLLGTWSIHWPSAHSCPAKQASWSLCNQVRHTYVAECSIVPLAKSLTSGVPLPVRR